MISPWQLMKFTMISPQVVNEIANDMALESYEIVMTNPGQLMKGLPTLYEKAQAL